MKQVVWVFVASWISVQAVGSSRDIFTNSSSTRRVATTAEAALAIQVGSGCAGFLIGPNIGMSAAHCVQAGTDVRSSVALARDLPADGRIVKTIEIGTSKGFDLWVFEIDWDSKPYPKGIKIVPQVQVAKSQLRIGDNKSADALYSLGFPADISGGKLIISTGYGKSDGEDGRAINNISLINGNSGGAIIRLKDKMLVSLVSGGPHRFGQAGWKDNDWNDSKHWNWGPAIWKWYQSSQTFQTMYPKGISRYYQQKWEFEVMPSFGFAEAFE